MLDHTFKLKLKENKYLPTMQISYLECQNDHGISAMFSVSEHFFSFLESIQIISCTLKKKDFAILFISEELSDCVV